MTGNNKKMAIDSISIGLFKLTISELLKCLNFRLTVAPLF